MQKPPGIPAMGPGVPLLGQQQQQAQQALQQAMQQLTMAIYTQAASTHVATLDRPHKALAREDLQQLARDAQTAAQCFFEGLGVATFAPPQEEEAA